MAELFVVRLRLAEEYSMREISYESIDACLGDSALESLFRQEMIRECEICCEDRRIATLPIMTFARLKDQLISNSTAILRRLV